METGNGEEVRVPPLPTCLQSIFLTSSSSEPRRTKVPRRTPAVNESLLPIVLSGTQNPPTLNRFPFHLGISSAHWRFKVARNLVSVIDDDESVRRSTKLPIESFGFQGAAFESAEDFLSSERLNETYCLIVDVQMPGMNGLELQSHLAATSCRIPIIFVTAYGNNESRRQALQAGAVGFLDKPFSVGQLLQCVCLTLRKEESSRGMPGSRTNRSECINHFA